MSIQDDLKRVREAMLGEVDCPSSCYGLLPDVHRDPCPYAALDRIQAFATECTPSGKPPVITGTTTFTPAHPFTHGDNGLCTTCGLRFLKGEHL